MMTAIELKEFIEPILLTYTLRGFDIRQIRTQGIPNIGRRVEFVCSNGDLPWLFTVLIVESGFILTPKQGHPIKKSGVLQKEDLLLALISELDNYFHLD